MKSKKILFITTLILFSVILSACSSAIYASTSWHGLTTNQTADTAYLSAGTQVYAVDLNSGQQKWKYPAKPNAKGFYAKPTLTDDGSQLIVPSYDHFLYSLDPASGNTKWQTPPDLHNRLIASPLIIGSVIYQPSSDENLYAIDLNTGAVLWSVATGGPLWSKPATDQTCGCIYVASMDHKVYTIDLNSHQIVHQSEDLGGSIVGTPAIGPDGTIYVGTFSSKLYELNPDLSIKGQPFATQDWVWAGPAIENNVLYFGDLSGYLYAVNAADLTQVWRIQPKNSIVDTPVVAGDNIYLTTEGDTLFVISSSGQILNSVVVGGVIYSAPLIAGDKLLVTPTGLDTTLLVALSLDNPSAAVKWSFIPPK